MILVGGEALIDLFVAPSDTETSARGLPALAVAGGSPLNLAIGLARLGARSAFIGGLSTDAFGRLLSDRMTGEGVDLGLARSSERATPLAIVATGPDGHPAYSFYARDTAHADYREADLPASLPDDVEAIALGSFSLAHEPVGSALAALAAREGARRVISLDPNLRPALIDDLAVWRTRFDALVPCATIVKASDEDLLSAYGPGVDIDGQASAWLGAGALLVVVTRGRAGATAWHASGRVDVEARPVSVVDTVGAGDTFHAAILAGLSREDRLTRSAIAALDPASLRRTLREAGVAASITCSRRGADLPRLAELQAVLSVAA